MSSHSDAELLAAHIRNKAHTIAELQAEITSHQNKIDGLRLDIALARGRRRQMIITYVELTPHSTNVARARALRLSEGFLRKVLSERNMLAPTGEDE